MMIVRSAMMQRLLCLCLAIASLVQSFSPLTLRQRVQSSSAIAPLPAIVVFEVEKDDASATAKDETKKGTAESSSTSKPTTTTLSSEGSNLPPVLQQIADERRQYQMNLGKAMDVLRTDMQDILTKRPDFSIYDDKITVVDPSGVQLNGLDKYKSAFSFFQTFIGFWFRPKASGLQFRMVYDFARSSIRISWHAVLVPKVNLLGGAVRPLYVDGISYYQLERATGLIVEHVIEDLMINNTPVAPPYGILSLLQQDALRLQQPRVGVPVGASYYSTEGGGGSFQ